MKVYAHYEIINDIEYRWRTLLQLGDSWEVCGTVVMKNPGSSKPINIENNKPIPIMNNELLQQLKYFDNAKSYFGHNWYQFTVDNTMVQVGRLIETYLREHNKPIKGIIQIFNLFNIRDVDLDKALRKKETGQNTQYFMTIDDDIINYTPPVYLGWGNLKYHKYFREVAYRLFEESKKITSYLDPFFNNNPFYHPQYLFVYGKNKPRCIHTLNCFINDKNDSSNWGTNHTNLKSENELDMFDFKKRIKLFKEEIDSNGADTCSLFYRGKLLNYEFYTQKHPNGEYINSKDNIAIDLLIDNNEFLIRVGTRRNNPEKSKEIAMAIDDKFNPGETNQTAPHWHVYKRISLSTSNDDIIHIMNELLGKIKAYRDKTFPLK